MRADLKDCNQLINFLRAPAVWMLHTRDQTSFMQLCRLYTTEYYKDSAGKLIMAPQHSVLVTSRGGRYYGRSYWRLRFSVLEISYFLSLKRTAVLHNSCRHVARFISAAGSRDGRPSANDVTDEQYLVAPTQRPTGGTSVSGSFGRPPRTVLSLLSSLSLSASSSRSPQPIPTLAELITVAQSGRSAAAELGRTTTELGRSW
jgi:hypothetical protein